MNIQTLLQSKQNINTSLLDIEEVLQDYGIDYHVSGQNATFTCPFHADRNPSCGMHIKSGLWKCFACGEQGNLVTFVSKFDDIEYNEAAKKIYNKYIKKVPELGTLPDLVEKIMAVSQQNHVEQPRFPEWILSKYTRDWTYMKSRGFDDRTLEYFNVVYDPSSKFQGFPVHDSDGQLVGVSGRNTVQGEEPRYKALLRYKKSEFIFNLHRIDKTKPVIAVEGEINCMKMHQYGYTNTVAFLGAAVTTGQIDVMRNLGTPKLIVFFDTDAAGDHGAIKLFTGLWQYMLVEQVPDHEDDPASMTKEQVDLLINQSHLFTIVLQ